MDRKDYESYPQGFNQMVADMNIPGMDDPAKRQAAVWGLVEMLIGS